MVEDLFVIAGKGELVKTQSICYGACNRCFYPTLLGMLG
jgi:hypothetical protein